MSGNNGAPGNPLGAVSAAAAPPLGARIVRRPPQAPAGQARAAALPALAPFAVAPVIAPAAPAGPRAGAAAAGPPPLFAAGGNGNANAAIVAPPTPTGSPAPRPKPRARTRLPFGSPAPEEPQTRSSPSLSWFCATMDAPSVPDVVLLFPQGARPPKQLWLRRSFLVGSCSYFKALFESEMVETKLVPAAEPLGDLGVREVQAGDISDSDAESADEDDADGGAAAWRKTGLAADAHRIVVRDTSHATMRAVMGFVCSGQIAYAPLRSRGRVARKKALADDARAHPGIPRLASAKQVYACASKLDIAALKVSALKHYMSSVDASNVVTEAYSNATAYPEIEAKLVDKLAASWSDVRSSPSMTVVEQQVGLGKRPRFDAVNRVLVKRLRSE